MNSSDNQIPEYDLIVIGSGPAGQKAALAGAKYDYRVALIEKRQLIGGVCLHTGTIPSKTLREATIYLTGYDLRNFYGESYKVKPIFDSLASEICIFEGRMAGKIR